MSLTIKSPNPENLTLVSVHKTYEAVSAVKTSICNLQLELTVACWGHLDVEKHQHLE